MELNKQNSEFKCIITFFNKKKGIMFSLTNKKIKPARCLLVFYYSSVNSPLFIFIHNTHSLCSLSPCDRNAFLPRVLSECVQLLLAV